MTTINNDHIEELLHRLANKVAMFNQYKDKYTGNYRECPFWSEKYGIEEAMKVFGIKFEYEMNDDLEYIAIKSGNIRVEI